MNRALASFADLLAPVSSEAFFRDSWEIAPLHVGRAQPDFYAPLVTGRDIEASIASGGLRYPAIQLARDGWFFAPEAFTRSIRSGGDAFTGIPNLERIQAEYAAGATISLPGFHRAWKPLGALAAAIEAELDHPVHTNVYITPGKAAGFAPHYDTHEVFVLQIAGRKRWRIEKPPLALPHRSQPFDPRTYQPSAPLRELELAPGDLLYLPRGHVHSTTTSDGFSIHVTLGVTVYTWVELLAEWVEASKRIPGLRRALPPGFAGSPAARSGLGQQLRQAIAELQQATDCDALLEGFAQRLRAARAAPPTEFNADVTAKRPRTEP